MTTSAELPRSLSPLRTPRAHAADLEAAPQILNAIADLLDFWVTNPPSPPYSALKELQASFVEHKQTTKRLWVKERGDVTALLGHIQTKLRTYGMKGYEPEEGMRLVVRVISSRSSTIKLTPDFAGPRPPLDATPRRRGEPVADLECEDSPVRPLRIDPSALVSSPAHSQAEGGVAHSVRRPCERVPA